MPTKLPTWRLVPQMLQQAHLPALMMWYWPFCRAVGAAEVVEGVPVVVGAAVVVAGAAVVVGAGVGLVGRGPMLVTRHRPREPTVVCKALRGGCDGCDIGYYKVRQGCALQGVLHCTEGLHCSRQLTVGGGNTEAPAGQGCQGQRQWACAPTMQGTAEQLLCSPASAAAMGNNTWQSEHLQLACSAPHTARN